ncbi:hypothetical protein [Leucobacter chromiisoli]|uniref:hypothetical protein n=1 Tax=Leucobacter chromiisoli TaxID=2796471 RepID=UPI001F45DA86|nr:hypothetical protein [Leucobacter chromiisoli]
MNEPQYGAPQYRAPQYGAPSSVGAGESASAEIAPLRPVYARPAPLAVPGQPVDPAHGDPAHGGPAHGDPAHLDPAHRSAFARGLDRALAVQRPVVLAHIRSVRMRHPEATPDQVIRMLQRRYLLAITGGGAAVGATAVIPAISTPLTIALSGVETVGFLESTALFAQSVAEVHGIPVENPDRARMLVMSLMLGREGADLLQQLTRQVAGRGGDRPAFWGEIVTKSLPRGAVRPVLDRLQRAFIGHFAKIGGGSFVGKALPFGIGAAVGGAGNHILGRRVVAASRLAFGPAPAGFAAELAPREGAERIERRIARGARSAGGSIAAGAGAVARTVKRAATPKRTRH